MSVVTGFYLHPASPLHDTGWGHPEHQGRLRGLASTVGKDLLTLHGHVEQQPHGEASVDDTIVSGRKPLAIRVRLPSASTPEALRPLLEKPARHAAPACAEDFI